jgi:hypothetical protein
LNVSLISCVGPVGVMVNFTVTGALVVLVSVPLIFPEPLAAIPVTVDVLSLVQLKVVPATLLLNTIFVMGIPEQIVCDRGVADATGLPPHWLLPVKDPPSRIRSNKNFEMKSKNLIKLSWCLVT